MTSQPNAFDVVKDTLIISTTQLNQTTENTNRGHLDRGSAENPPTFTMDPTGLQVAAYVGVPDIWTGPYTTYLVRTYWDSVKSGMHDDKTRPYLIEICHYIVNLSSLIIMEGIKPITSDWHRKAPRIYELVHPSQCFFGIDERSVLANMKNILPQCFANSLDVKRIIKCESLDLFTWLVAKEVTARVNYRIAERMSSNISHLGSRTYECNCISFETLNTMIGLVIKILRCMCDANCRCTPVLRTSEEASSTSALKDDQAKKPKLFVVEQGPCEVTYCILNREVRQILTEVTEFTRNIYVDKNASLCYEELDSWLSSESFDSIHSYLDSDTDGKYSDTEVSKNHSVQITDENRHSYDLTDTEGQSEDWTTGSSVETIDSGPGGQSRVVCQTVTLASPCEDQPSDSTAAPAVSSDLCSSESAKMPEDDTAHILVVLVLTGLLLHTAKKAQISLLQSDFDMIIKNLRDKALKYIKLTDIVVSLNHQTVKKTYKAVFRDVFRQFGSVEVLLQAFGSEHFTANNPIIQALKTHLTVPAPTPKKNAIARFFSSVGKAIMTPFKA